MPAKALRKQRVNRRPFRKTGQGVAISGEAKAVAKASLKGRESLVTNPNSDDLGLGRLKGRESGLEGRYPL